MTAISDLSRFVSHVSVSACMMWDLLINCGHGFVDASSVARVMRSVAIVLSLMEFWYVRGA